MRPSTVRDPDAHQGGVARGIDRRALDRANACARGGDSATHDDDDDDDDDARDTVDDDQGDDDAGQGDDADQGGVVAADSRARHRHARAEREARRGDRGHGRVRRGRAQWVVEGSEYELAAAGLFA